MVGFTTSVFLRSETVAFDFVVGTFPPGFKATGRASLDTRARPDAASDAGLALVETFTVPEASAFAALAGAITGFCFADTDAAFGFATTAAFGSAEPP